MPRYGGQDKTARSGEVEEGERACHHYLIIKLQLLIAGKTYTMGSAFVAGGSSRGVIPNAMDTIFARMEASSNVDFKVRVGFVEILTVSLMFCLVILHLSHQTCDTCLSSLDLAPSSARQVSRTGQCTRDTWILFAL